MERGIPNRGIMYSISRSSIALAGCLLAVSSPALGQWTQFGGPNRDFKVPSAELKLEWPDGGPKRIWSRDLGEGYSGMSVVDGTVYTMYRKGGDEVVVALDAGSGATRWERRYPAKLYQEMFKDQGNGPRATPLVIANQVFTVGISAMMHCLDRESGKIIWSHDLMKEYDATPLLWGYSSSPLQYKDTLIVPVGGKGNSVMAFNIKDGSVVWSRHDFANGYASPVLIDVDGQAQVVVFTNPNVIGIDPDNGDLLWKYPHKTRWKVNASTPIWGDDNILFVSSAYNTGSRGLKLTQKDGKTNVEKLWAQKKMQVHFGDAIRIGDYIYGTSGGNGPVFFGAIHAKTGELAYRKRDIVSKAQIVAVGDTFIMLGEDGDLVLATATPQDVTVHGRAQVLEKIAWTAPTFADGVLYLRDKKTMMALDLKP